MKIMFDPSTRCFHVPDSLGGLLPLTFSSPILAEQELATRVWGIWKHVKKHPAAMALLQRSLAQGPLSIVFTPQSEMRGEAHWHNATRTIAVLATVTDAHILLDSFIFELNNSVNDALQKVKGIQCKDAEDYALQIETAEYETSQSTVQIMIEGVKQHGWPETTSGGEYRKTLTLKQYLENVRKNRANHSGLSHFDGYKLEYYVGRLLILDSIISPQAKVMAECQRFKRETLERVLELKKIQLALAFLKRAPLKEAIKLEAINKEISALEQEVNCIRLELNTDSISENSGKIECIQMIVEEWKSAKLALEAAEKERVDLVQQKENLESEARRWKDYLALGDNKFNQAMKNVEECKLENKKMREYLDQIKSLPHYSKDSLLQKKVEKILYSGLKDATKPIPFEDSILVSLIRYKRQNQKLLAILERAASTSAASAANTVNSLAAARENDMHFAYRGNRTAARVAAGRISTHDEKSFAKHPNFF